MTEHPASDIAPRGTRTRRVTVRGLRTLRDLAGQTAIVKTSDGVRLIGTIEAPGDCASHSDHHGRVRLASGRWIRLGDVVTLVA